MGRRGPKPEPASIKKQKGSSRRPIGEDASPDEEKKTLAETPAILPPEWMKQDALKVWERLAPRLIGQKLLFQIDAETFGRYCRNFARWLKMQEILDTEGETYESESPHGKYKRAHPAYVIADRLERQLTAAEANFGLNPAERQRIFAARAAGSQGDLFGSTSEPKAPKTSGARKPANAPAPARSAVGFLN
ncbi:phage terminase small subunit P27 family [Chelativorans oligotrophicus]|uniref:phage terminase small subunit P27 family n=1 Tax=Chelativorans oligotrophicus TaxID=449974 RepID=UPI0014076D87|nr:phage terminase small subunit P27 family [Chelativorans oligotrophicus]